MYNPDIKEIDQNIEPLNGNEVEMHEVFTVLNLKLPRNLQIPSSVDTLILEPISKDGKHKKITIVDYKYYEDKIPDPTYLDKLQALLMCTSIFCSFIDTKIKTDLTDWDVLHDKNKVDLPHIANRPVLKNLECRKSFSNYELLFNLDNIKDSVKFILKNPVTDESVEVDYASIAEQAMDYLHDLSEFYFKNKAVLKQPKISKFVTPRFVPQKILDPENYERYSQCKGTQIAFF
jgi:hypothetical protein